MTKGVTKRETVSMKCFFVRVFMCVPEGWRAKPFGCGPFISQARMSFYQTDVSYVLLLGINTTNTNDTVGFLGTFVPYLIQMLRSLQMPFIHTVNMHGTEMP